MINFNGELQHPDNIKLSLENRAFKYQFHSKREHSQARAELPRQIQ